MDIPVLNESGVASGSSVSVADVAFGSHFNEALVHQVVVAYMAGGRSGTRSQKTRSEVRGGGAKPWRQKGTGRARAGTIRSPIWRTGGVTFAAKPQDHGQKVNKKMYRAAMRSIVSELVRQDRLMVVDSLDLDAPSTKAMAARLAGLGVERALLVDAELGMNTWLSSRNLKHIDAIDVGGLDPVNLVGSHKVVMTVAALQKVGEWLA